jgi:flagella basal body P-ring formation protein FlgA
MKNGRERNRSPHAAVIRRRSAKPLLACILFILFTDFSILPLSASGAPWSPEAVLKNFLRQHYPWADVDIRDLQLSAAAPSSAPVAVSVEKTPPGRSIFRFEFKGGRSVLASATIKAFDRVFMSRSSFPKGYILQQDDLYPTLMESGRIPRGALRTEEQAVGKPLLRSVVSNVPLTSAMVSETALVKRGRRVSLVVESDAFIIRTAGVIKRDAAVGEYVKVENTLSRRTITGLLVDENTVRVEY